MGQRVIEEALALQQKQLEITDKLLNVSSSFLEKLITVVSAEEVNVFFEERNNLFEQVQNISEQLNDLKLAEFEVLRVNNILLKEKYKNLLQIDNNLIKILEINFEKCKLELHRLNSWKAMRIKYGTTTRAREPIFVDKSK